MAKFAVLETVADVKLIAGDRLALVEPEYQVIQRNCFFDPVALPIFLPCARATRKGRGLAQRAERSAAADRVRKWRAGLKVT